MGILSSIVAKAAAAVATDVALDAAETVLDKAHQGMEALEARKEARRERKAAANAENAVAVRLLFLPGQRKAKGCFSVYDTFGQQKYYIRGEGAHGARQIHVYDPFGRTELGTAQEKSGAIRIPVSRASAPNDVGLYVAGYYLGKMKVSGPIKKRSYSFDFNDWTTEGDFRRNTYQVFSGKFPVMAASGKAGPAASDPYLIDITDQRNELLCLLIAAVIFDRNM